MAYKDSRFVSNKASSVYFYKLKGSEVNTVSKLQQQGFKAFVKNVWNQEQKTIRFEQGDMGLKFFVGDYCRISSECRPTFSQSRGRTHQNRN